MPPLKAVITVIIVPGGGRGDGGTTIMSVAAVSLLQCYKNLTQNQPACGSIPPLSHSGSFHTLRAGSPGGPSHASLLVDLHKTPTMITFLLLSLSGFSVLLAGTSGGRESVLGVFFFLFTSCPRVLCPSLALFHCLRCTYVSIFRCAIVC